MMPSTPNISIRTERASDIAAIYRVHVAAFPTADEARLVDMLRRHGDLTISLVAEIHEQIVGHISFSPVLVESWTDARALGLAPVAVLPGCQRRGIGKALIEAGMAACRRYGADLVVVLGEPAYYRRFGFRPAAVLGLDSEYDAGDAFMAMLLKPDVLPRGASLVRYSRAFRSLESH